MEKLKTFLSIHEIEENKHLQYLYWTLLVGFFLSFETWISKNHISISPSGKAEHICPPYFQNCSTFYFLQGKPFSYDQYILYSILTLFILLSALYAIKKNWTASALLLIPPLFFKFIYVILLSYLPVVDFEYFHLPIVLIFIFCRNKMYFIKRAWVITYLFAGTMKFTESWIVGNYFSAIGIGIPLFPRSIIPLITNCVAIFETISPWFLLSSNRKIRLLVLYAWVAFHLYSIIMVGFLYPLYCTPILLALFLYDHDSEENNFVSIKKNMSGWLVLSVLSAVNILPFFISSNRLYTLQGLKFGVSMFDANHQFVSNAEIVKKNGDIIIHKKASNEAMRRASPYNIWYELNQICKDTNVGTIKWRYYSSINGNPFYQLINTENMCKLKYHTFRENDWILTPETKAPLVGYPEYSVPERLSLTDRELIHKQQVIFLTPIQVYLEENLASIQIFYWLFWIATCFYFFYRRIKKSITL
jgi:hypothetical protein